MTARIIVDALSMLGVAAESFRHEGKPFLRAFFAAAHIAFTQTHEAEFVKELISLKVHLYRHDGSRKYIEKGRRR